MNPVHRDVDGQPAGPFATVEAAKNAGMCLCGPKDECPICYDTLERLNARKELEAKAREHNKNRKPGDLYMHPDTGGMQDPKDGTIGCPVGPPGVKGPPGEIVLTKEDRQEAEILHLRLLLISREKEEFLRAVAKQLEVFDLKLGELRTKVTAVQSRLSRDYGIDFTRQQIEQETGRIIPVHSANVQTASST